MSSPPSSYCGQGALGLPMRLLAAGHAGINPQDMKQAQACDDVPGEEFVVQPLELLPAKHD